MADPANQETIFQQEPTQTPPVTEPVQNQEPVVQKEDYADLLSSITSADGRQKYSDVSAALKSLPHANQHITELESEMVALKADLDKRSTAEEIMSQIDSKIAQKPAAETPSAQPVDLSQIEALVDKRLNSVATQKIATDNLSAVTSKMSEVYGEKAEAMFYAAGQEAGLSAQELNALAAKSPVAALKLIGVDGKVTPAQPAKSVGSVNTEALQPNVNDKPSAKVPVGASSSQMVSAWRNAKKPN